MKKNILFVIPDLRMGGAEKSLLEICKRFNNKINIHILTIKNSGQLKSEFINNCTDIKEITSKRSLFILYNRQYQKSLSNVKINKIYNKFYANYKFDYIISFLEGSATHIVSNINTSTPKLSWIHTSLKAHQKVEDYTKFTYNFCVSKKVKEELDSISIESSVIYNLIDTKEIKKQKNIKTKIDKSKYNIVTVARFDQAKALDRLIHVSNEIFFEGINHNLYILGSGRLYKKYKKISSSNHIHIINKPKYVYNYMNKANLFVLASKYEGYGMVVDEALHLKTNVLVTNTNSVESVDYGRYGQICENNKEDLKRTLISNINNEINLKFDKKNVKKQNNYVINQLKAVFEI